MITKIITVIYFSFFICIFLNAQSIYEDEDYKKYNKAMDKYWDTNDKNNLRQALTFINRYIKKSPKDPEGYYERSTLYDRMNDFDNSIADINKAIDLDPKNPRFYVSRGGKYTGFNNNDNIETWKLEEYNNLALKDFTKAIELEPINPEYYSERGWSFYWTIGKYDLAIIDLTKAIDLSPDYYPYYFERGISYQNNKQYDLAILDFSKGIELDPNPDSYYRSRAECYGLMREYELAVNDLNKAIEVDPGSAKYNLFNRAGYYELLYNYELAILDRTKLIEFEPDDGYCYDRRAATYILMGEYEKAVKDYTEAILKGQTYSYLGISNAYRLMKSYDRAMNYLKEYFTKTGQDDCSGLYYRGLIYIDKGDYDLAIKDFDNSIQRCASNQMYLDYWGRGKAYHLQKNYSVALDDYSKCISTYETFRDSVYSLSDNREISNVYYSRGTLYLETEKYNESLKDLDKAISLYSVDADYYVNRGYTNSKLGNYENAKADWQRAIELNPALKSELEKYLK